MSGLRGTAVIIGASSGIGLAAAAALAEERRYSTAAAEWPKVVRCFGRSAAKVAALGRGAGRAGGRDARRDPTRGARVIGSPSVFERLGLARPPVLAAAITVVTGAVSVWGLVSPAVLDALQRTPAAGHGEVWRWLTSLVVQDGGVLGTTSNLIFLGILGGAAEQVVGRVAMTVCYLVAGLAGQAAGVLWQPVGAGNSVAVCGLAGIVAWSLTERFMPRWAGSALALWIGALLGTWWPPLIAVGVVAAGVDRAVLMSRPAVRVPAAVVACAVVAVVLIAVGNVHGLALAVATVVGAVPRRRRPTSEGGRRL